MKKGLKLKDVRNLFLDYFFNKGHHILESQPLLPKNDNSLLFINSGVAGLKNYFLGIDKPPSYKLANSQICIRTNDLDNVGKTGRHLSLFEMLGNFSINNAYNKKKAIFFAFDFLTNTDYLGINKENLWITVHEDDIQSYNLWNEIGIAKNRIIKLDSEYNFWNMGKGPCGYNTEIYFDRGIKFDNRDRELFENDIENTRFLEIWNIVFSDFINTGNNELIENEYKNIDTGAGLERIVAISQQVESPFQTSLFVQIKNILKQYLSDLGEYHYNLLSDHLRTLIIAVSQSIFPSGNKQGHILKKLFSKIIIIFFIRVSDKNIKVILEKITNLIDQNYVDIRKYDSFSKIEDKFYILLKNEITNHIKNAAEAKKAFNKSKITNLNKRIFLLSQSFGLTIDQIIHFVKENNIAFNIVEYTKYLQDHKKVSISSAISSDKFQLKEKKLSPHALNWEGIFFSNNDSNPLNEYISLFSKFVSYANEFITKNLNLNLLLDIRSFTYKDNDLNKNLSIKLISLDNSNLKPFLVYLKNFYFSNLIDHKNLDYTIKIYLESNRLFMSFNIIPKDQFIIMTDNEIKLVESKILINTKNKKLKKLYLQNEFWFLNFKKIRKIDASLKNKLNENF